MGSVWSALQSAKTCSSPVNCDDSSPNLAAGAAIIGEGTFVAFFVTALVNIGLSFWAIKGQWGESSRREHRRLSRKERRQRINDRTKKTAVRQSVIISFSDQQLVTGLALAITLRFFTVCDMSAYHYDIACYLLLCSVVTHLCSLVTVDRYFNPFAQTFVATSCRAGLLFLRCTGIAATIIFTGLIFFERDQNKFPVFAPPSADDTDKFILRPAVCFFVGVDSATEAVRNIPDIVKNWSGKNWTHGLIQYASFLVAIMVSVPVALLHSYEKFCCGYSVTSKILLWVRLLVICAGLGLTTWSLVLAWMLRSKINSYGWLGEQVAGIESQWTFGQLVSLLLLAYAPFTACSAAAEKYDLHHKVDNHGDIMQMKEGLTNGYEAVNG